MAKRKILVDSTRRELEAHGTETFPMTVNHDDLWSFEGKNVPSTGIMIWRSVSQEKARQFIRFIRKVTGSDREKGFC